MMLALQLFAFIGAVQCLPWDGVKPTGAFDHSLGFQESPKTTQAARLELHRRQAAGDVTCGYYESISSEAVYCLSQATCATNSLGAWGCCLNLDDCRLVTSCIDSTALSNYASNYLASNPWVYACTEAANPLCTTQYLEIGKYEYTGFECGSRDDYLTETFYTTAANATVPSITFYNAFYNPIIITTPTSSSSSITFISTPTTNILPISTPPLVSSPSSSPSSNPSSSPSSTPTPGPTPAPIAAIVGGVVGGIAAIAIVGLIIFFLLRNKKRQKAETQPQHPVDAPMQQAQPPHMYPQQPQQYQQYQQYPGPASAQPPAQNYPSAAYQTVYPEKTAPQETSHQLYGSPQLSHNEPAGSGSEQRMSTAPPYSPNLSSAGGFDPKSDVAINSQPAGHYHELSEQNR